MAHISERWAVRPGWLELLKEAKAEIDALPAAWEARLTSAKEKFGYLRLSVSYRDGKGRSRTDKVDALIERYRKRSLAICEDCGQVGRLRMGVSIAATRCDTHAAFAMPFRKDDGHIIDLPPVGGPIFADGSQGTYRA